MLKNFINYLLRVFDAKIVRYSKSVPLDVSKEKFHPLTLSYLLDQKKILINSNINDGRSNRFYKLNEKSFDPYIFSINYCLKKRLDYEEFCSVFFSMIKKYKKISKINDISDFFGIKGLKDSKINYYPVWAAVLPWENTDIKKKLIEFPTSVKVDRAKNGFIIKSDDPTIIMKEDDQNSLKSHINQYYSLIKSIKEHGYDPELNKNYIEVELLLKKNKFCWKPSGEGNHRSTVVSSLGYKNIKTILTKIIRYEEAEYWPNVVNGTFKKNEAEVIFNKYFYANPPEFNKIWISYCEELNSSDK